jgi:hypothetical protein
VFLDRNQQWCGKQIVVFSYVGYKLGINLWWTAVGKKVVISIHFPFPNKSVADDVLSSDDVGQRQLIYLWLTPEIII